MHGGITLSFANRGLTMNPLYQSHCTAMVHSFTGMMRTSFGHLDQLSVAQGASRMSYSPNFPLQKSQNGSCKITQFLGELKQRFLFLDVFQTRSLHFEGVKDICLVLKVLPFTAHMISRFVRKSTKRLPNSLLGPCLSQQKAQHLRLVSTKRCSTRDLTVLA